MNCEKGGILDVLQNLYKYALENGIASLKIELSDFELKMCRPVEVHTAGEAGAGEIAGSNQLSQRESENQQFKSREERHPDHIVRYISPNRVLILSGLVGIVRFSHPKTGKALIRAGQTVEPSQIVAVIECLGIDNYIHCQVGGKVVGVLAEDGQVVQWGTPLVEISTA